MQRLSKQEKKQLKVKHHQETRKEKRKRSHINKRAKRSLMLSEMTEEQKTQFYESEKSQNLAIFEESQKAALEGIPLIFDLSYCNIMTSVEIGSLQSQISASVGFLRQQNPQFFSLMCSNASGELKEKLTKRGSKKWFLQVFEEDLQNIPNLKDKPIIYLSPEGNEPLLEIDQKAVYVIGGLVDRTIQSSKSFARGGEIGAKVLRLPILEHGAGILRPERRVFNVNTVVEFLHFLAAGKTCEEAFLSSIPKRWTLLAS